MEPLNFKYITAIVAVIGALVPITATINGWYTVRLERQKHQNTLQLNYLDRAIDPEKAPQYRESVLKFLRDTLKADDAMRSWAETELENIREVLRLQNELAKTSASLTAAQQKVAEENQRRIAAEGRASQASAQEQVLNKKVEELEKQLLVEKMLLAVAAKRASVADITLTNALIPQGTDVNAPMRLRTIDLGTPAVTDQRNQRVQDSSTTQRP